MACAAASSTAKPPPPPPPLPAAGAFSAEARKACAGLVYTSLKLTLEGKKKLTTEQRAALGSALDAVIQADCPAFALAVAVWLRNKKELGNRLVSTNLLAACVHREATRPFARQAAKQVIRLPTDLAELNTEFAEIAAEDAKGKKPKAWVTDEELAKAERPPVPACLKKIATDVMDSLPEFQAAKYDSRSKVSRTKKQLKEAKARLQAVDAPAGGNAWQTGRSNANKETKLKECQKRVTELEQKLRKITSGDLCNMLRHTHAGKRHDLNMMILRKRYPETEEEFKASGLAGEFDPDRAGEKLRLEVPPTWDRELSEKGNVPRTWADLLKAKDARGNYTLPYMALLRNLRNILLMGLRPSFLRKHVLERLVDRRQIQGSGQTPISLTHTWTTLQKEFTEEQLQQMREQSEAGLRDIFAYKCLLKKIRPPILGTSDKLPGIIGAFLGEPVWAPCGLKRQNECFLASNRVTIRDGKILEAAPATGKGKGKGKGGKGEGKIEKWLPVAVEPLSAAFLAELKETFDQAIQVAASCAVEPLALPGAGPTVLWMDLSNPPLEMDSLPAPQAAAKVSEGGGPGGNLAPPEAGRPGAPAPSALHLAGLKCDHEFITTRPGQECELEEISTHRQLTLELRYFAASYIDYNIQAFKADGTSMWNSTYSNPEVKGKNGENCAVHCRDIAGNPSPTEPALRTLHLDLDRLEDEVFCLIATSQNFTGNRPEAVSIALRECHNGGACPLHGNHEPHDCKGKVILAQDIGQAQLTGGTTIYCAIYRDVSDPSLWVFRNILDMSLEAETRVAQQMQQAASSIFRRLFLESALKSTMDPATVGYVRLCQLYQALTSVPAGKDGAAAKEADVRIVLTGIKKKGNDPSAEVIKLSGRYVDDLETVRLARRTFSGKAVDSDVACKLAMDAVKCGDGAVAGLIRIANNAKSPIATLAELRSKAGRQFPYGTVDARGHILDAYATLPPVPRSALVPGQVESSVAILRNMLLALESGAAEADGDEMLVRYVDKFLPRDATPVPDQDDALA